MTTSQDANPYEPSTATRTRATDLAPRWPVVLVLIACAYYLCSACTLPFGQRLWLGELPVLAVVQLPKVFLKSLIHSLLLSAMHALGWSRGSASPDFIATHGWAMGFMVSLPAIALLVILCLIGVFPYRRRLISLMTVCALIDAVVTLWFDHVSNLKLFNASFW